MAGESAVRRGRAPRLALRLLASFSILSYPLLVYFGLRRYGLRPLALLLLLAFLPNLLLRRSATRGSGLALLAWLPLLSALLLLGSAYFRSLGWMLALPSMTNLLLLSAFGLTLWRGPPMIERFARLQDPDLDGPRQRWCLRWTQIWCGFFFLNGLMAALFALFSPLFWWTLHTSVLGYAGMGALLAAEWWMRKHRFPPEGRARARAFLDGRRGEISMNPLGLLRAHAPDSPVAFGAGGEKSASDLREDAARIAQALPEASEGSHVLLVLKEDRYAMAAALLGVWQRGHAVALPPNTRREAILRVRERPEVVAVVHDTGAGLPLRIEELLASPPARQAKPASFSFDAETPLATLFTSASTGASQAQGKNARQLLGEARLLAEHFGIGPGARIVATVSPLHIYGLLFGVLLPLCCGGAFLRETPLHAEAISQRLVAHRGEVLVTVPVHLRALEQLDAKSLPPSLRRVFSSAGPLSDEVATRFIEAQQVDITELLGSTETGGIAYRSRRSGERWQPLPGISVQSDPEGHLLVHSPFLASAGPFRSADLAEMYEDGSFTHLGRSDGIVKIAGRRVSLAEMEEWLRRHPGVDDAALLALPTDRERGHLLLAAISPATAPVAELKEYLLERFDASCLPKRLLALESLPREANGKLPRQALLRVFDLQEDGEPLLCELRWGERMRTPEGYRLRLQVPRHYIGFEGHFPGYPLLPAATQLEAIVFPATERIWGSRARAEALRAMQQLKFSGRILPGDALELRLAPAAQQVHFEIRKGDALCSSGILVFDAPLDHG